MNSGSTNVADRLARIAAQMPAATAVVDARNGAAATCTFRELDADATALARGLVDLGVTPGTRLVLLVPPGVEFVKLVFALLRCGATTVLVDPGMGRKHLVNCLAAADPAGFVAVSRAQAVRTVLRRLFPRAAINVTVGRRWFWGGATYRELFRRGHASNAALPKTRALDPAAIIFTSGSTGPPKGVHYTHEMFETQVAEIQRTYDLRPGGVDLACFALFGLFNSAMGVTTVFPDMDFSRPASAEPRKLLAAANFWRVTQAFASPAVWDKLGRHCERTGNSISTLRKIFSCGAPVPASVLKRTLACVHPDAQMHTPYGATEALPVSTIEAREVLDERAAKTAAGAGVCVGRKFDSIEWRVIRITDDPIATMDDAEELPPGEIGELIVRGPQVSHAYLPAPSPWRGWQQPSTGDPKSPERRALEFAKRPGRGDEAGTRPTHPSLTLPVEGREPEGIVGANIIAKIPDVETIWHRLGDVGYFDPQGRFWYCGRKAHRVETRNGALYTECCEAVFNAHSAVRRCALVGDGAAGLASPVIVVESALPGLAGGRTGKLDAKFQAQWEQLIDELLALGAAHLHTAGIGQFLLHPSLPVDVRHNAKINREQLAAWATSMIADHKLRPRKSRLHVLSHQSPVTDH